jgi:hypothetical protein
MRSVVGSVVTLEKVPLEVGSVLDPAGPSTELFVEPPPPPPLEEEPPESSGVDVVPTALRFEE